MTAAQVQRRRETATFLSGFIGAVAEIVVDTTNNRMILHDGMTVGGWPAPKFSEVLLNSATDNVIAHSGGGQANATLLTTTFNRIVTVAATGDSCALPIANPGALCIVINSGANAAQLFGNGTNTINGIAGITGIALAAGKIEIFFCVSPGAWFGGLLS